ncbi:MAG TPA: LON peptidase substrate-binding domain-containing protein, partial [Acidimicrobiia bacterium]
MPETAQATLPVLPLHNGVVFPQMAVTIQVSSAEGQTALRAAEKTGGRLLIVPRLQGRYASVGTIATVQSDEDGNIVVSGESRARVGAGSVDETGALWVEAEESPEVDIVDEALDELVAEYRAVVSAVLENRGLGRVAERLLSMENPSQLADLAVYSPDLS